MPSFQISITPSRRAAGRFVNKVRRELQKALAEEHKNRGLTQSDIARTIGVHRSVINRELRGLKDITLGRVGELAYAMGRKPVFSAPAIHAREDSNAGPPIMPAVKISATSDEADLPDQRPVQARAA